MNNQKIVLALIVIFSFLLGRNSSIKPGGSSPLPSSMEFLSTVELLPTTSFLPKSNFEWLLASIASLPSNFISKSEITTSVVGSMKEISTQADSAPILSKHYYVGQPGRYDYSARIIIETENDQILPLFFSPKRVELMKVTNQANGTPVNLSDILPGTMIEVSETVDLSTSNINDENVISVSVKVLK